MPKSINRISIYKPKLANTNKLKQLFASFTDIYIPEIQKITNEFLYNPKTPKLFDKSVTQPIPLPARLSQVIGKSGSSIVRSIQAKVKKAENTPIEDREKYQEEILQKYNNKSLKINLKNANLELDSRFIDIQSATDTKICDYWIKITSLPSGSFYVPLKLTRHMKDLIYRGFQLKTTCLRLNSDGTMGLHFIKIPQINTNDGVVGIDLGRNKLVVVSNGDKETTHDTSISVKEILEKLQLQKKNSKNNKATRKFLINQINYSLKHDIPWNKLKYLVMEDLIDMKRGKKWGNTSADWRIGYVLSKLIHLCEENDVQLIRINAAYSSQECEMCHVIDKKSRIGEKFLCISCGYETDADYNGSRIVLHRGIHSSLLKKRRCVCL